MPAFIDITGQKYGRLTAIRLVSTGSRKKKGQWLFQCDCGNQITCTANRVKSGNTKSCGCQRIESSRKNGKRTIKLIHEKQITHGYTGTRLYRIYKGMKARCYNPNTPCFGYYGGKGVGICDEWLENPQNFIDWALSHGYNDNMTIERRDSDKGYSPDNCEFIAQSEQARRATIIREHNRKKVLPNATARVSGIIN